MSVPVIAPRRVKADIRFLFPDLRRPGTVLRCRADQPEGADLSPQAVLERVETELAQAAWRYRLILGVGLGILAAPVLLAALSWQLLFALPPSVYEPYARGAHLPFLSLYEAIAFTALFVLLIFGGFISYASIQAMYRLNPDYRLLVDADDDARRAIAGEASSGRWPRVAALLVRARQFEPYRPLVAEAADRPEAGADSLERSAADSDASATPDEQLGPEPPLTLMSWGVARAVSVTALGTAIILLCGLAAAWVATQGWSDAAAAAAMGAALIGGYLLMTVVVWGVARGAGYSLADAVGLRPAALAPLLSLAFGVALGARLLSGLWGVLLQYLGVNVGRGIDPTTLLPSGPLGALLTVLAVCVLAPFAEEVIFRGVLLSALRERWGDRTAILVSSLAFASVHVLPVAMVPIFVLALILGRLYVKSRTLWLPIATHALFNSLGLIAIYLLKWSGAA